jgi:cell division protein ZapE
MTALLDAYRARLAAGEIKADPAQAFAVEKLETLTRALGAYKPDPRPGFWRASLGFARKFGAEQRGAPPTGLYFFGGVGRGKSMLMDLFYLHAPVEKKRRVHFHAFMLEVHARIHSWRQTAEAKKGDGDPIVPLAEAMAGEAFLLCFDEFQVTNIADAMILGRLFEAMFAKGVVVVATSNIEPDDLYANGLQRERFLPAIELLKQKLDVLALDGGIDYRRIRIRGLPVYHAPLGADATAALERAFATLTEGALIGPATLDVGGRDLALKRAGGGVVFASFGDLCAKALGAGDYLALAKVFHTLVLDGVPVLDPEKRNEARRFVNLIDALYEHRAKLVMAAAAPPEELHAKGDHAFEFQRTASRLFEMQSQDYLAAAHIGGS